VNYLRVFGCLAATCALISFASAPAFAWETSFNFGKSDHVFAAVGHPKGPIIKIMAPAGRVEVQECQTIVLPDCRLTWNGQDVWVSALFLKNTDKTYMPRTRLRKSPNIKAPALATLPKGSVVLVYNCKSGWCDVHWKNKRGWLADDDLLDRADDGDF
jgi:SH3-like domain-containing protein